MSPESLDTELTPDDYRLRYLELKARAAEAKVQRPAQNLTESPRQIPTGAAIAEEVIPAGWYWPIRVPRGVTLRLLNTQATPGVSVLFWNANDTSERINPADSVKLQWTVRLGRGNLLFSDMGRVLASITGDTCGMHDSLAGGSTKESNARKYRHATGLRNTRDNFVLAAAKFGLGPRDVGPCITFFAPLVTDPEGRLIWEDNVLKAGDYVDLRAEMDLLAAISNCPHPLSPGAQWRADPVRAILWKAPQSVAQDYCRTSGEEAVRGFENTDSYLETGDR